MNQSSTRIGKLSPSCEGFSEVAMSNRAGFREARDLAAGIASEADFTNTQLLAAVKWAQRYWRERTEQDSEVLAAAVAKATEGSQ